MSELLIEMTDKLLEENLARASLAESVELPADKWVAVLEEVKALRKLVFDLQALFDCKDGLLSATGECSQRARNLLTDTAKIIHAVKYAGIK